MDVVEQQTTNWVLDSTYCPRLMALNEMTECYMENVDCLDRDVAKQSEQLPNGSGSQHGVFNFYLCFLL